MAEDPARSSRLQPRRTVPQRLATLVAACVLPVWLCAGALTFFTYRAKLAHVEYHLAETADSLAQAVDQELAIIRAALFGLTTSPALQTDDFTAFRAQVEALLPHFPRSDIVMLEPMEGTGPVLDTLETESATLRPPRVAVAVPARIRKRDGSVVPFDAEKIFSAIRRAGAATGDFDESEARLLTAQAVKVLSHRFAGQIPDIERIQDVVEQALISANHFRTMRAYSIYREQRARLRHDKKTVVDVAASVNEYLDRQDWRVSANANQGYSLGGLILNVSGKVVANYWLNHVYPPEVGVAHREGDLHVHDLDMLAGYCAGWSLRTLLQEGLNGVPGKVEADPPKHLSSAVGQIVNFLGTLQNEWAGAQAFSSFDTYMAPFVRKDNLPYAEVRQSIQELIYNLNVPSRWGTQTPFTNLTFDWTCPDDLSGQHPIVAGEEMPFTYGDLQPEMDMTSRWPRAFITADPRW